MWQHHDSMMPWGWGVGMWLIWIVLFLAIFLTVYFAVRSSGEKRVTGEHGSDASPEEILDRRFAEGEISKEEYEEKKDALGG